MERGSLGPLVAGACVGLRGRLLPVPLRRPLLLLLLLPVLAAPLSLLPPSRLQSLALLLCLLGCRPELPLRVLVHLLPLLRSLLLDAGHPPLVQLRKGAEVLLLSSGRVAAAAAA
jgi:hypothetical protein